MTKSLTPQEAVIYLMVMVSASDREMVDPELSRIGAIVRTLPAFRGFDQARTLAVAQECQKWLQRENGFEEILAAAAAAIPEAAHETAYALAVDIAVADLQVEPEEVRMLQILRERLKVDRAAISAIERAAKARHRTF
jgi:tellurite resistance protein